ncbi:MAG: RNA polymerase sigma factor SigJ [Rhizobiales bacterium 62-17]|nr:sigma-70 family RNA polymerase sigma factor [Hyphomicrobiales bacterium]OJY04210.1 MAG: RNA polymerase sigma factor SigJ [Rhizobiales bacterium 62-17]
MTSASSQSAAAAFDPLRPDLIRVAYRMLGSVADAEDVVQDAFLRWLGVDREAVREPAAFLRRIVTRLCLDRLKSARHGRETYVGLWLPEPVVEPEESGLDDVTLPLLLALERLSPLERAAFLLHDVFGLDFEEVEKTIGREAAACRQLASRARAHVRADRPRYPMPKERGFEIAEAFFAASRNGDTERLRALLAADVTIYADGGGKAPTRRAPVIGFDNVTRFFAAVFAVTKSRLVQYGLINGLPGFVTIEPGDVLQTTALEIVDGRVVAIYAVRNPEKLKHVASALH